MLLTNLLQKQPAIGLFEGRYPESITKIFEKCLFNIEIMQVNKDSYNKTYLAGVYLESSQISMDQYL